MKEYLISAQAAVEEIARRDTTDGNVKVFSGQEIISILHSMPQAVPRMRGRWIDRNGNIVSPFWERYECSECGARSDNTNYCPNCGAKMENGGNNG